MNQIISTIYPQSTRKKRQSFVERKLSMFLFHVTVPSLCSCLCLYEYVVEVRNLTKRKFWNHIYVNYNWNKGQFTASDQDFPFLRKV